MGLACYLRAKNTMHERLKQLRLSANLSQAELAEKIGKGGYNEKIIEAIETGNRNIGLNILEDWAKGCGYELSIEFVKK